MRELNPIGREDNTLLLVSADGEQFSVVIDETLMRTLKEHRLPDSSGQGLSPRQIQDAIRSGETIQSIAERSGTSLSLVERFAHPVLEELQHMVDLAKSIRIELPADRFNEVAKKPFGEVVEAKLKSDADTELSWMAKRLENSCWEISLNFAIGDSNGYALWTFDPRRSQIAPENSTAQSLTEGGTSFDSPFGKKVTDETSSSHPSAAQAVVTAENLQAFRSRRAKNDGRPAAQSVSEKTDEDAPVAEVISISNIVEPAQEDLGEESQVPIETEDSAAETEPVTDEAQPAEAPKKSRAPMPSWDQIVRGTQSDDGEAF